MFYIRYMRPSCTKIEYSLARAVAVGHVAVTVGRVAGGRGRGSDTPERAPDASTASPAAAGNSC